MIFSDRYFTRQVTLERPTSTKTPAGDPKRAWAQVPDTAATPASIQPLSARERASFGGRLIQTTHVVYVRADLGFKRGDRLRDDLGTAYAILGVRNEVLLGELWALDVRELLA